MTTECPVFKALATMVACAILAGCGGGDSAVSPGSALNPSSPGGATGSATISWTAPIENHDGGAISDLAGYRIYHGTSANALNSMVQVSSPGISVYVIDNLPVGTHYFALTAYNSTGAESDRSEVASKTIQ